MLLCVALAIAWSKRPTTQACIGADGVAYECGSERGSDDPLDALDKACDALAALGGPRLGLADAEASCRSWAAAGECSKNAAFMHERCSLSCLRRVCLSADYDASAGSSSHAQELVAGVNRAVTASGESIEEVEECAVDPDFDHENLVDRLFEALQGGIPADNGCAFSSGSSNIMAEVVGGGGALPAAAAGRALRSVGAELRTVPKLSPELNASHVYMHPVCFSRSRLRAAMKAVASARSLRCMAVYRKPIELRRLNQTGFALMCTVTNLPTAFTNTAPLFVYAKKLPSEVTSRPVWPNKVPACDRSDLEGDVK